MTQGEEIGKRIAKLRKRKGWTQDELARKIIGWTRSIVNNREHGIRSVTLWEAEELAGVFGITIDELIRGVKTENVSIHDATGMSDAAIESLRSFWWQSEPEQHEGLNLALSKWAVLDALSRYVSFRPAKKGYYLSARVEENGPLIDCRMSAETYKAVLGQNLLHLLDKLCNNEQDYPFEAAEIFSEIPDDEERGNTDAEEK